MTKTSISTGHVENTNLPEPSKRQIVINLLAQEGGVTLDEMSKATDWRPHSVRSFLTGLKKKGHRIESDKVNGVRQYRIVHKAAA